MNEVLKRTAIAVFSIAISACGEKENKSSYNSDKPLPKSPSPIPMNPTQTNNESDPYEEKFKKALKKYTDTVKDDYKEFKTQSDIIQKELESSCQDPIKVSINCKSALDKSEKFLSFQDRQASESLGYWMPADLTEFTNNSVGIIEIANKNLIICHIDNIFSKNYSISFNLKTITSSNLSIKNIQYTPKYKKTLDTLNLEYSKYGGSFRNHTFNRINKEIFDLLKEKTYCK